MPEVTIYEYRQALRTEHKIWPSRELAPPTPAAYAEFAHKADKAEFCRAVSLASDRSHNG